MNSTSIKEPKKLSYLLFALIAFGFLGLEFGVLFISRIIDGRSMNEIGNWPIHWYGAIAHWTLTIIVWFIGVLFIYFWAKRKNILSTLVDFKKNKHTYLMIFISIIVVILSVVIQVLFNNAEIPQILFEYKGFVSMYPNNALIVTIFQVLYYFVEMLLVFIMIVLFQRFGELVFKNKYIPYGSIGLMLTWGMIHFVSHPSGALGVTIWALIPGLLYIFGKKSFWPVYILLVLGFLI